ncbi:MAG TPA: ATP-binding cassette domain-containing protein [Bacteroidota bacterium]|nr:ATP-binding cassette domain-containing protein [Bacteroidota bacterium]
MIRVDSLTYRYPGAPRDALSAISLQISEGSFVALTGANGSGKSTLARCLNGLLLPSSGQVLVDGLTTTNKADLPLIRRKVGVLFQDPNHQMTSPTIERELAFALQNLGIPPNEIQLRIQDGLRHLGFEHRRLDPPSSLSGGEKQRLALACVMMLQPRYLVLDEATSFLSPASRRSLMDDLMRLRKETRTAVLLITQLYEEAVLADRVVVLENGRIVFDDEASSFVPGSSAFLASGIVAVGSLHLHE